MALVNGSNLGSQTIAGADEQIRAGVNVSDATQMENNFIDLMVAQIRNQDPTKPVDSTEFLNQFSAMSQVKSLENMTKLSQSNLVLLDNLQTLAAAGLVGQQVKVGADSVTLDGSKISGQLTLAHTAGSATLRLTGANGVTHEVALGGHAAGALNFSLDPRELGLSPGRYSIEAVTDSGEYPTIELAGEVTNVRVGSDGPVLDVAGIGSVPFYTLTEFGRGATGSLLL
ncbi:Basal-body rod modification protein FlgD [Pseudomonas sp. 8AS]|uniref:flagellar hook capping FlgD N-terminal domain-containing protein n=1 Tax=Pseudomonas sp. 8AS TaxID=2653163 RepID=UPI0012EF58FA|nr:flagellar hook capping FlgD N-terminal domain-containing protein [Pseudomonas sp. 8AS]VXC27009.1 Basal-body rod modification protein FlgD [Pseudomonas sp. 8AS]